MRIWFGVRRSCFPSTPKYPNDVFYGCLQGCFKRCERRKVTKYRKIIHLLTNPRSRYLDIEVLQLSATSARRIAKNLKNKFLWIRNAFDGIYFWQLEHILSIRITCRDSNGVLIGEEPCFLHSDRNNRNIRGILYAFQCLSDLGTSFIKRCVFGITMDEE